MIKTASLATLAGFVLTIAACAGTAAPETGHLSAEAASSNASSSVAANAITDLSGTWAFDVESSDVAPRLREQCASGNAAAQTSCWNELKAETKLEKIRFSQPDDTGRSTWTSFALQGNKEIVFVEVPVLLTDAGSGHVLAKIAGKPAGLHADGLTKAKSDTMRIDVVDARTIALTDSTKGRLVYTKD